MSEPQTFSRFALVARRWRELVDQRCAHFVELHTSGRWRRYYTEAEFRSLMCEAFRLAETWARIAPRPDDLSPAQRDDADPARRTAA